MFPYSWKTTDPRLAESPQAVREIQGDYSSGKQRFGNLNSRGMGEWKSSEFLTVLVLLGGSSQGLEALLEYQALPAVFRSAGISGVSQQEFQVLVPLEGAE